MSALHGNAAVEHGIRHKPTEDLDLTEQATLRGVIGSGDRMTLKPSGDLEIEKNGNADDRLLIPVQSLETIDAIGKELDETEKAQRAAGNLPCEQCGEWFKPRAGRGGRAQKFCSAKCRTDHNNEHRGKQAAMDIIKAALASSPRAERKTTREPSEWEGRIPRQAETWVKTIKDGAHFNVEVVQESNAAEGTERIFVTAGNAVGLARCILWAAGFHAVGIYACVDGGNADLEDGATADQFDWVVQDEKPATEAA